MNKKINKSRYDFIDLFAGIGGFHIALKKVGKELALPVRCVFVNENDKYAKRTYVGYFGKTDKTFFEDKKKSEYFWKDVQDITRSRTNEPKDVWKKYIKSIIPEFNILCAGFPCQPFSQVGKKEGFDDARGTLFGDILRIAEARKPKVIFLENVRHLVNHEDGETFRIMRNMLNRLHYKVEEKEGKNWKILKASDFGLPTHRPRVYIVAFHKSVKNRDDFRFPPRCKRKKKTMQDVFGPEWPNRIGYTLRVGGKGSGMGDRRNWDTYTVSGVNQTLKPEDAKKMMGFNVRGFNFKKFSVSETQAMKQLGNSVAVPVVKDIVREIFKVLDG